MESFAFMGTVAWPPSSGPRRHGHVRSLSAMSKSSGSPKATSSPDTMTTERRPSDLAPRRSHSSQIPDDDNDLSTIPDPRSRAMSPASADGTCVMDKHPDLDNEVAALSNKLISAINHQTTLDDTLSSTRLELERSLQKVQQLEALVAEQREMLAGDVWIKRKTAEAEKTKLLGTIALEKKLRQEAEQQKKKMELELESLTAALFEEANKMVIAAKEEARQREEALQKSAKEEQDALQRKNDMLKAQLADTEGLLRSQSEQLSELKHVLEAVNTERDDQTAQSGPTSPVFSKFSRPDAQYGNLTPGSPFSTAAYWDQVLSSYTYSGLYTVQSAPLRTWAWAQDVYRDSRQRFQQFQFQTSSSQAADIKDSLVHRWHQFYSIVRGSIRERSLADVRNKVFTPVALSRREARFNHKQLRKLRSMTASGMGLLLDEGLSFGVGGEDDKSESYTAENAEHEWKGVLERSVALMDMVLRDVSTLSHSVSDFEEKVFAGVEDDPELSAQAAADPVDRTSLLARRLVDLLEVQIPSHIAVNKKLVRQYGRPSRLTRYWLPGLVLFLSSSTILRILVNRKADIINWLHDLGNTAKDFWFNWVVEPTRKVIGTIRHDANSEIAIMSRDSLQADRDSLERMVVDFASDKPELAVGTTSPLTDAQIADIKLKVKEGDVSPVLKAYERDLKKPIMGAITGDLVRALLIQVQKTKVDLEVAMSGIDALLKSQELVFGFVGLTPGILVTVGVLSYLRTLSGGRKGMRRSQRATRSIRVLRSIDRILSEAVPTQNNLLSYKDHGLLVCEVHMLRKLAHGLLPREVERDFREDLEDLVSLKAVSIQLRALDRIRWSYSRWLNR